MSHGINANVVHRWRQLAREAGAASTPVMPASVPVALPAPAQACPAARRGDHEPGALCADQQARPVRLLARRARAVADAAGQPHRRAAAALLASAVFNELSHIAALIEAGGDITLGHLDAINRWVATASDEAQCLGMLVRRKGESLEDLLRRLDAAIRDAYENERRPSSGGACAVTSRPAAGETSAARTRGSAARARGAACGRSARSRRAAAARASRRSRGPP